jgi:hypothetical protein
MSEHSPLLHACDPQRPGDVILGVSREDPVGRELIAYASERALPGLEAVAEQARLDDVLEELAIAGREGRPEQPGLAQPEGAYDFSLLTVPEGEEQVAAVSLVRLHLMLAAERRGSTETAPVIAQPNHYLDFEAPAASAVLSPDHDRYLHELGLDNASPALAGHPRVRVIDSGCTDSRAIALGVNILDGGSNVDDRHGHGSLVTAIIDDCTQRQGSFEIFKVADGTRKPTEWEVLQALSMGPMPPIVNLSLSLGFGHVSCTKCGRQPVSARTGVFEERFRELGDAGVIVVAAAGNGAAPHLAYPSRFSSAVAVMAAFGSPRQLAPYSNWGAFDQAGKAHRNVYICPGGYRHANEGPALDSTGNPVDGTSYAAAYMTGLLATGWAQGSKCTEGCPICRRDVLNRVSQAADRGFPGFDPGKHGNGLAVLT